jgi:protein-arginine kinase activator protein McsA
MLCDECGKNCDFLVPVKVVDSKEVKDLRLCSQCFEIYRNPNSDKHLEYNRMTYPNFLEGSCNACSSESKYLREVTLNLAKHRRDILLCPACYKSLRFLIESGDLRDFPPFISGVK